MTTVTYTIVGILILSILCLGAMGYKLCTQSQEKIPFAIKIKLLGSGFVAFIADALGIGSFAINIAFAKLFKTFKDEQMPAVCNGAQVLPGIIESIFFMQLIEVDALTLGTLIAGTCLGGTIGGALISRLNRQHIRLTMLMCFSIVIALLICNQLQLLPVGGDVSELHGTKLCIGFFAVALCGALTAAGVGLFITIQAVLFMLNVSPLVAFPIMTAAGAMQQPITTLVFVLNDVVPLKKTLILSLGGCLGVIVTLPIFRHLTVTWLHTILLGILLYNLYSTSYAYWQVNRKSTILDIS